MARARKSDNQKIYSKLAGPLLLSFGIFYLTFHLLSGERGLYALLKEERKLEVLQAELKDVEGQRKELDHRVRLMSSNSLDLDLLDEQLRRMLGDSREDELVIPTQHGADSASSHIIK